MGQRFEDHGRDGLYDRSSRPQRTRSSVDAELAQRMAQLRRARMPMRKIATVVGRSVATVSRFLAGLGLFSLKALEPRVPVLRYERQAPESSCSWTPRSSGASYVRATG